MPTTVSLTRTHLSLLTLDYLHKPNSQKTSPPRVFKELATTIPKFLPPVFIQAACNLAYCRLRDESHIGRVVRIVGYANEGYWKYRAIVVDDYLPMRTYTA